MLHRKRPLKILAMISSENSGESSNEDNVFEKIESPLPSEEKCFILIYYIFRISK